jgi:hypothetical protein
MAHRNYILKRGWKMHKSRKTKSLLLIFIISALIISVLLLFFIMVEYIPNSSNSLIKQNEVTLTIDDTVHIASPTITAESINTIVPIKTVATNTIAPDLTINPIMNLSQTINGIEIHASNIRREINRLTTDICFQMPNNEDWMINQVALRYENVEIKDWEGSLIEPILPAADTQPGRRCDAVSFNLSDTINLSSFTITVFSIYAPPREGETCERINYVQKKLDEQSSGIKVKCQESNGLATYQVLAKPASMSDDDVRKIVSGNEFFTIEGPWVFTVNLK